jgi:REP element-mobilizing transposase RayT
MLSTVNYTETVVCSPLSVQRIVNQQTASLHYHIVLNVAENIRFDGVRREELYNFLAGAVRLSGGTAEALGGTNEIHLLVGLNSFDSLADLVRRIKLLSENWMKRKKGAENFAWRNDFTVFTVSLSQCERVRRYIFNQTKCGFASGEKSAQSWRNNVVPSNNFH